MANTSSPDLKGQSSADTLALIQSFNDLTKDIGERSLDRSNSSNAELLANLTDITSRLRLSLLSPADVVISFAYSPSALMAIRALIILNVFKILITSHPTQEKGSSSKQSCTYTSTELAHLTGAEELLLIRFLRVAVALNYVDCPKPHTFKPNPITYAFADPSLSAGVSLCYDNAARPKSNLSGFLEYFMAEGYICPTDSKDGPWQRVNNTVGRTTFDTWVDDGPIPGQWPGERDRFSLYFKALRGGRVPWHEFYDMEGVIQSSANSADSPETPFLVDLGGGIGSDLTSFVNRFPTASRKGAIILTDLPEVIADIPTGSLSESIQVIRHSFFHPLPLSLQGSEVYYTHQILHDWPDDGCLTILTNIRNAMIAGHSRILLNEYILPDHEAKCGIVAAMFDVTMMTHHSAMERTEGMWRELIGKVQDLEVKKIWTHPGGGEGIVEVTRSK